MVLRDAQLTMYKMLKKIDKICEKHGIEYYLSDGTLLGAVRHKGFIPWDDDLDISMTRENYKKFEKVAQKELGDDFFVQTVDTEEKYGTYGIPMKVRYNHSLLVEHKALDAVYNQGIFIDVFPMDKLPNNPKVIKFQKILSERLISCTDNIDKASGLKKLFKVVCSKIGYKRLQKILRMTLFFNNRSTTGKYTYGVDTFFYNELIYESKNLFPLQRLEFEGTKFLAPHNPDAILTEVYGDYMKIPAVEDRQVHSVKIEIYKEIEDAEQVLV
ncbi:MAG: LicD family protein [Sarcina sp.]